MLVQHTLPEQSGGLVSCMFWGGVDRSHGQTVTNASGLTSPVDAPCYYGYRAISLFLNLWKSFIVTIKPIFVCHKYTATKFNHDLLHAIVPNFCQCI